MPRYTGGQKRGGRFSAGKSRDLGEDSYVSPRGADPRIPSLIYDKNGSNNFFSYKDILSAYFEEKYGEAGLFIRTGKEAKMRKVLPLKATALKKFSPTPEALEESAAARASREAENDTISARNRISEKIYLHDIKSATEDFRSRRKDRFAIYAKIWDSLSLPSRSAVKRQGADDKGGESDDDEGDGESEDDEETVSADVEDSVPLGGLTNFKQISASRDHISLWKLIERTHTVPSVADNKERRELKIERDYATIGQYPTESVEEYKLRFDRLIDMQREADMKRESQFKRALRFINGLDNSRFAKFKVDLENDFHQGKESYPKTLDAAYRMAANRKEVQTSSVGEGITRNVSVYASAVTRAGGGRGVGNGGGGRRGNPSGGRGDIARGESGRGVNGRGVSGRGDSGRGQSGGRGGRGRGGGGRGAGAGGAKRKGPRDGCFTCGGDHYQRDCPRHAAEEHEDRAPVAREEPREVQRERVEVASHAVAPTVPALLRPSSQEPATQQQPPAQQAASASSSLPSSSFVSIGGGLATQLPTRRIVNTNSVYMIRRHITVNNAFMGRGRYGTPSEVGDNQGDLRGWTLFDNCATICVMNNPMYVSNIREDPGVLYIVSGIGGKGIETTLIADTKHFGTVLYSEDAEISIISQSVARRCGNSLSYDDRCGEYKVTTPTGVVFVFYECLGGMHGRYHDPTQQPVEHSVYFETVSDNENQYPKRNVMAAMAAKQMERRLGYPSKEELTSMVRNGVLTNLPATAADVARAALISGNVLFLLKETN